MGIYLDPGNGNFSSASRSEFFTLPKAVEAVWKFDRIQFVIVLDEWECIILDSKDDTVLINFHSA